MSAETTTELTGAALLREAARVMRERAEAALVEAPAPWTCEQDWIDFGVPDRSQSVKDSRGVSLASVDISWHTDVSPGPHVASWHPAVALAVAEVLDDAAERIDEMGGDPTRALTVARAYLGLS